MSATTIALLTLLISSPFAGALAVRYIRPRQTQAEELADLRADRDEDRNRLDRVERRLRRITDYVHTLRQHIADEKGPPPPPWPEGIDQ